jgi:glycosidase
MINSQTGLDGQFDFPLRIRIVEAVLMRSTQNLLTPDDLNWSRNAPPGMQGLAQFMDSNDTFYPPDAVMSTFIGNHDLPRSIHYAEDPSLWPDSTSPMKDVSWGVNPSIQDPPAIDADSNAYDRMGNAFAVLFTNKGAPLVYYGDEIGLPGAGDPDNRRPMPWSPLNPDQQRLHDRVAALGQIRAQHPALRRGSRTELFSDIDLWVFEMSTLPGDPVTDSVYVGINRSDTDRTSTMVPSGLTELLTNAPSSATVTIPARQTRIWSQPALGDAGP